MVDLRITKERNTQNNDNRRSVKP